MAETVDTAGKAVAFRALTVLASLAAIMIVPTPAFRSMAFGIMLSVVAVLVATLTLLPAVGKLGTNVTRADRLRRGPRPEGDGSLDRMLRRWGRLLVASPFPGRCRCVGPAPAGRQRRSSGCAPTCLRSRSCPPRRRAGSARPQVTSAFGRGRSGRAPGRGPPRRSGPRPGDPRPCVRRGGCQCRTDQSRLDPRSGVVPHGASTTATGATIDHLRHVLAVRDDDRRRGGPRTTTLQQSLASYTPLVLAILGVLGFLLLLIALGAPLIAALGVLITALSVDGSLRASAGSSSRTAACPGCWGSSRSSSTPGLLCSSEPWSSGWPWTTRLFMRSAATRRCTRRTRISEHAMVGSMRASGRVVLSAAAVMIAVFLTFALSSGAQGDGRSCLAIAVALETPWWCAWCCWPVVRCG